MVESLGELSAKVLRLRRRIRKLRAQREESRLRRNEAEQALQAIRSGDVESLVIETPSGPRIFSLEGADHSYRVLVEEMNEGAATLAEDGTVLYCNGCFARLLETPLERVIGGNVERHLPQHFRPVFRQLLENARLADVRDEIALSTAAGEEVPIYVALNTIVDEGRRLFCVVATDLREQKRGEALAIAERAARATAARLTLLSRIAGRLLSAEDPQAVLDELCRAVMAHLDCQVFFNFMVDVKTGTLRLSGCAGVPQQQALGVSSLAPGVGVCGLAAQERRRIVLEDVLHSQDERVGVLRSLGVQGYCCHPLLAEGELLGTLSFGTRTRPRFAEDELELMQTFADQVAIAVQRVHVKTALSRANGQLLEGDRRKNEFLAILSHELRNPLAPIRNSVYILEHATPGGEQAARAQQVIDRQVRQLSSLVDDLLDVTRITRNKVELRRSQVDLNELVRRVLEDHRSAFQRADVRLELSPAGEPVPVNASATCSRTPSSSPKLAAARASRSRSNEATVPSCASPTTASA
jgi:PAS domain S-box-containing protein